MQQPRSSIQLRGQTKRRLAEALLKKHQAPVVAPLPAHPIRIVCISDTHNKQPDLPPGDVLIHAGDLTENGSFDEVQAGLTWLSSLPFRYKILIAGNHDVLLDEAFLQKYPERRYGQTQTKADLHWGNVTYLEDEHTTLEFSVAELHLSARNRARTRRVRTLSVFGSPWTPRYGVSAFQYAPNSLEHWADRLAGHPLPDIVVTHGPPRLHCDQSNFRRAGCAFLAEQVARIRPRLVVFGHIHAVHGREDVVLDRVQRTYETIANGWAGWLALAWMAVLVLWGFLWRNFFFPGWAAAGREQQRLTTFVNASVVGGRDNELRNAPVVVDV